MPEASPQTAMKSADPLNARLASQLGSISTCGSDQIDF